MSAHGTTQSQKSTVVSLQQKRDRGEKIVVLTGYDAAFARLLDGLVDVVLVGDSLGMVVQGEKSTLGVTLDQMAYHARMVSRGLQKSHLVVDMPFLTYQGDLNQALQNAGKLVQEGFSEAVKMEGGREIAPAISKIASAGIPVMGHLGMTPQHMHRFGGFTVQARDEAARKRLLEDAKILEDAGAYAVVLEAIPADLAAQVTDALKIPTIGIGAGPKCSGQVLVLHDVLGMERGIRRPKFVRVFAPVGEMIETAVKEYAEAVRSGSFPTEEHSYR